MLWQAVGRCPGRGCESWLVDTFFGCFSLQKVLISSFHAMDDMLRSPEHERQVLTLKQACHGIARHGSRLADPFAGGQNDLERLSPLSQFIFCGLQQQRVHPFCSQASGELPRRRAPPPTQALAHSNSIGVLAVSSFCGVSGSSSGSDSEDGRVEAVRYTRAQYITA